MNTPSDQCGGFPGRKALECVPMHSECVSYVSRLDSLQRVGEAGAEGATKESAGPALREGPAPPPGEEHVGRRGPLLPALGPPTRAGRRTVCYLVSPDSSASWWPGSFGLASG